MPILDTEILWRPAQMISSTPAQNGGRMNRSAQIASTVKNALFPDVGHAERQAGSVTWRKAFIHIASASNLPLLNARVTLDSLTPGDDAITLHPGTQTDTEDLVTGRAYGIGTLASNASLGATTLLITPEQAALYSTLTPFRVGDSLRISNRGVLGALGALGEAGSEEWLTLTAVTLSEITPGDGTLSLSVTPALAADYTAGETLVASAIEVASIVATIGDWQVTSAAGTLDTVTAGTVVITAVGTASLDVRIEFSSASAFTMWDASTNATLGEGSIYSVAAPAPVGSSDAYFRIDPAAWGGTWAAGDSVTFTTTPAALPLWYRRAVPAGAGSLANNHCAVSIFGESNA